MQQKVRWAILGAGKIAHKFAGDFKAVPHAELVAVACTDRQRGRAFADKYNIPSVYSYDGLYNSPDVDAVYIATTHNFHYEQSKACLQHGKAVLCEKPVTINDRQFTELAALAREQQVFFMEAMWTYFLPAIQRAKAWIDSGAIGTVSMIQADFGYKMEPDPTGRMYNLALAGGSLLDLGIYPIAFSTFFTGQYPTSIKAASIIGSTGVDESTGLILTYHGCQAALHCTILSHTPTTGYIFGSKGFIEIPIFFKASKAMLYNDQKELVDSFTDERSTVGYDFETREATQCILQGNIESAVMPHQASLWLQQIMTDARRQVGLRYPIETGD